MKPCIFT